MFRRNRLHRGMLEGALLTRLNEANRLLDLGQATQAAPLFAQLAQALEASSHPRRAANLHARVAHAFADASALAGHEAAALDHARRALHLFKQYAMVQRFGQFYGNINSKFQARGMASASAALQSEFGLPVEPAPVPAQPAARLPGSCPKCGAPVRSDEVDWIDARSAECPCCGTVLRAD
jgi:hypothetical protein